MHNYEQFLQGSDNFGVYMNISYFFRYEYPCNILCSLKVKSLLSINHIENMVHS